MKAADRDRLFEAVAYLLRSCSDIDPYSYHDAPWSPIHEDAAEFGLRALMKELAPKIDVDRW